MAKNKSSQAPRVTVWPFVLSEGRLSGCGFEVCDLFLVRLQALGEIDAERFTRSARWTCTPTLMQVGEEAYQEFSRLDGQRRSALGDIHVEDEKVFFRAPSGRRHWTRPVEVPVNSDALASAVLGRALTPPQKGEAARKKSKKWSMSRWNLSTPLGRKRKKSKPNGHIAKGATQAAEGSARKASHLGTVKAKVKKAVSAKRQQAASYLRIIYTPSGGTSKWKR